MVDKLVRVVAVIGKDFDSVVVIVFGNGGGAGGTAALPVFALAENVKPVVMCLANKIGKPVGFGKICIYRQAVIRQNFKINVMNLPYKSSSEYGETEQETGTEAG